MKPDSGFSISLNSKGFILSLSLMGEDKIEVLNFNREMG
jgi:hypothetical protein